jgi:hypothetical protein
LAEAGAKIRAAEASAEDESAAGKLIENRAFVGELEWMP